MNGKEILYYVVKDSFIGRVLCFLMVFFMFVSSGYGKDFSWQPFNERKLQEAIENHQPVIVDFYAQWCPGCHELDRVVFSNSMIKKQLSQVTAFRLDATDMEAPKVQEIIDRYSIVGLPSIVFLNNDGKEIRQIRVEGAGSVKEFSKSLESWASQVGVHFSS